MTNAPEGAFKIPNFIDQLEPAKFGYYGFSELSDDEFLDYTSS